MNAPRPLTVGALRELLEQMPADALVLVPGCEGGWDTVHGAEIARLGDLEPLVEQMAGAAIAGFLVGVALAGRKRRRSLEDVAAVPGAPERRYRLLYGPEGSERSSYTFPSASLPHAVIRSAFCISDNDRAVTIEQLEETPTT